MVKNRLFGQFLRGFPRFGQRRDVCPYKLKKKWRIYLELAQNRRNFAADLSRFKIPFLLQIVWLIYG